MYFFKYHPLKEILKNRELTDTLAIPYFYVFIGLTALLMSFPLLGEMNGWDNLTGFLSVILSIAGVYYAYLQNGGPNGYDFIQKYIVLGWVVSVRVSLISIPIFFALYFVGDLFGLVEGTSTAYDVFILAGFEVILYQRIGRHIRDTKTIITEPTAPPDNKGIRMKDFPGFMQSTGNLISSNSQSSGVKGWMYDGADHNQMAYWNCQVDGVSKEHIHDFDEYFTVVQGKYTLIIDGQRIDICKGEEYFIPKNIPHAGEFIASTRTIHCFGGKRAERSQSVV